jgi:hypothetical protein
VNHAERTRRSIRRDLERTGRQAAPRGGFRPVDGECAARLPAAAGHAELEARVARAYEQFVASGGFSFRLRGKAARVGDVVKFSWAMVRTDGQVAAVGLEFLVLEADGRARLDYQFIES